MNVPRLVVRAMAAKFVLACCLILLPGTYILAGSLIQAVWDKLTLSILFFGIGVGAWMVFYAISLMVGNRIVIADGEILVSVQTPTLAAVPRFFRRRLSLSEISGIFIARRGYFNQHVAEFSDVIPSETFNYVKGELVPLAGEKSLPNPDDSATSNQMIMLVRTKTTGSFAVSMLPFPKSHVRALTEQLRLHGLSVQLQLSIDSE
jgi:hypothetical protein